MTTKGQVTVPKHVREDLGLRPGDEVDFVRTNGGYQLERIQREDPFVKWRGAFKRLEGVNVDELIEEMRGR
jgi:AbrB family looped-hinge helix DNA binding protein